MDLLLSDFNPVLHHAFDERHLKGAPVVDTHGRYGLLKLCLQSCDFWSCVIRQVISRDVIHEMRNITVQILRFPAPSTWRCRFLQPNVGPESRFPHRNRFREPFVFVSGARGTIIDGALVRLTTAICLYFVNFLLGRFVRLQVPKQIPLSFRWPTRPSVQFGFCDLAFLM